MNESRRLCDACGRSIPPVYVKRRLRLCYRKTCEGTLLWPAPPVLAHLKVLIAREGEGSVVAGFAERFGLAETTVEQQLIRMRRGRRLTLPVADRWATFLGLHLDVVWEPLNTERGSSVAGTHAASPASRSGFESRLPLEDQEATG